MNAKSTVKWFLRCILLISVLALISCGGGGGEGGGETGGPVNQTPVGNQPPEEPILVFDYFTTH
jgi:hypothetical protein